MPTTNTPAPIAQSDAAAHSAFDNEPHLARPGAGLPFLEARLVRWFGRAMMRRRFTWDSALDAMEAAAERLLQRADRLPESELSTRVLIPRLTGMEDSSRYWSPVMVLEHLCITAQGMLSIAILLSNGKETTHVVSTAAVKPKGLPVPAVLTDFSNIHRGARTRLAAEAGDHRDWPAHEHPWFGQLNATDWIRLLGMHTQLHERQFNRILAGRCESGKVH
jgi:hypothetical protein